ncbi:unnamed protein product [Boreogadus saida]
MMRSVQQQDPYSCAAGVKLIIRRCPVVSKHRDHNLSASLPPTAAATSAEAEFVVQQNEFHELKFWDGGKEYGPAAGLQIYFPFRRFVPPSPPPTTALTCVLRCFPCEPNWAGSPFLHRPPTPPMVRMTRSKTFQAYLPSCHRTYSCIHCRAHLANHDELISKSFQGSQGRAYLFNSVVNVGCGPAEERVLLTGLHAVADIYCENCKTTLGWKYEHAFESSQKYKEGKFIIELAHMIKDNGWD